MFDVNATPDCLISSKRGNVSIVDLIFSGLFLTSFVKIHLRLTFGYDN